MASQSFKGIIAYPVTPFDRQTGGIDSAALRAGIERLIAAGVHAIAPLGSTGESAYLDDEEWDQARRPRSPRWRGACRWWSASPT